MPPGGSQTVSIIDEGAVTTTHRVKYSHHADGNVAFSQDGKIITTIRTKSTPTNALLGHTFSFQFWGLGDFDALEAKDLAAPSAKAATVFFETDEEVDPTRTMGRVVGWCYPRRVLDDVRSLGNSVSDPAWPLPWPTSDGKLQPTLILAPHEPPADHQLVVYLTWESSLQRDPYEQPVLYFHGGYNRPTENEDLHFIGIRYADKDESWDEHVRRLGSIDYHPSPPLVSLPS